MLHFHELRGLSSRRAAALHSQARPAACTSHNTPIGKVGLGRIAGGGDRPAREDQADHPCPRKMPMKVKVFSVVFTRPVSSRGSAARRSSARALRRAAEGEGRPESHAGGGDAEHEQQQARRGDRRPATKSGMTERPRRTQRIGDAAERRGSRASAPARRRRMPATPRREPAGHVALPGAIPERKCRDRGALRGAERDRDATETPCRRGRSEPSELPGVAARPLQTGARAPPQQDRAQCHRSRNDSAEDRPPVEIARSANSKGTDTAIAPTAPAE